MVERLVVRASILHRKDVVARLHFPGQSIRAADNVRNCPLALLEKDSARGLMLLHSPGVAPGIVSLQ